MPIFLDTRGHSSLGIGLCARCSRKFALDELESDPNFPGLMVCREDKDSLDPYRLPAREQDRITLEFVRPDVALSSAAQTPTFLGVMSIFGINQAGPVNAWAPNTVYPLGSAIVPLNENDPTVLPQYWFLCVIAGVSGPSAPIWPTKAGVLVGDYISLTADDGTPLTSDDGTPLVATGNGDGTVTWLNLGIYVL